MTSHITTSSHITTHHQFTHLTLSRITHTSSHIIISSYTRHTSHITHTSSHIIISPTSHHHTSSSHLTHHLTPHTITDSVTLQSVLSNNFQGLQSYGWYLDQQVCVCVCAIYISHISLHISHTLHIYHTQPTHITHTTHVSHISH